MFTFGIVVIFSVSLSPSSAQPGRCPVNMAPAGSWCVDIFEASVWSLPPKISGFPQGLQFGVVGDDYPCSNNGNDCSDTAANPIYAASVPDVIPAGYITWFQAQQACTNVGKQLLPNGIWQMAAAGTPDTGGADDGKSTCNTDNRGPLVVPTGTRTNCVSNWGVFDMVGNLFEWVEEWIQDNSDLNATDFTTPLYGMDEILGVDEAADGFPSALYRGGFFNQGTDAGVFELTAGIAPSQSDNTLGFRCGQHR